MVFLAISDAARRSKMRVGALECIPECIPVLGLKKDRRGKKFQAARNCEATAAKDGKATLRNRNLARLFMRRTTTIGWRIP